VWSERWSLALAREVRHEFPDCVIVAGGPQVPERETVKWATEADVDICVLGEGERQFASVLRLIADGMHWLAPEVLKDRIEELSALPSPYLAGVFDDLVARNPHVKWQALQETNRGCPYQCTFCDWGSATYDKVRKFPVDQAAAELEWFASHRIELLYNCDANFGMLEQDVAFTDALIAVSKRTGYPQKFRAAYAKKINDRVFGVAKAISDAGLSKGATISFQSMDAGVLSNVKRLNPVAKSLAETFKRYADADVSTYTELIVGLPGETLASFKRGVGELLHAGQHRGLAVYPCMALRNSSLSQPASVSAHGIETRTVRLLLLHGEPDADPAPEKYELVTSTASMPHADWREAWTWGIVVQALHCGGLTDVLARAVCKTPEDYVAFYDHAVEMARSTPWTVLGLALAWWDSALDAGLRGEEWPTTLPEFGAVQWPPEEAVFLQVVRRARGFWSQFRLHATHSWTPGQWWEQKESVSLPDDPEWEGDLPRYAREVVWYGRKGGRQERRQEAA